MIEMQTEYQTPCVVGIAFKFGGPLCQSTELDNAGGNLGYGDGGSWGDDDWD